MLYRKIPKNGDELSILGFGCMRFPLNADGTVDQDKAIQQIHYAIDNGVNYFDTAWPYHGGMSEYILGQSLKDGYRDKVKIATKLPTWLVTNLQDMESYLDQQLQKLETDRIDYYLLHALNGVTWDKLHDLGVIEFLEKALADGRIINVGFSFHGTLEDFKRIVDGYPWIFCQIQYNFLDQEYQAGIEGLHYAASRDLGVIIMEPLRGGNLGLPTPPPAIESIWKKSSVRRSPVEWALRWIWNHPEVTLVLSGMNENTHIEENLAIAQEAYPQSLSEKEGDLVNEAAEKYRELMKVDCTGCGYCLPCPEGVLIPSIFEVYNKMHMFGNEEEAQFIYAIRLSGTISGDKPGYASACVECGECLEKCPQNIEIPDHLSVIAEQMEGPELENRVAIANQMLKGTATP